MLVVHRIRNNNLYNYYPIVQIDKIKIFFSKFSSALSITYDFSSAIGKSLVTQIDLTMNLVCLSKNTQIVSYNIDSCKTILG